MNPTRPDHALPGPAEGTCPSSGLALGAAVARELRAADDLEQLARMLPELAAHRAGAGLDRARLLLWDATAERFAGGPWSRVGGPDVALPLALERARRVSPSSCVTDESETEHPGIPVEALDPAVRQVWQQGGCVIVRGTAADAPWRPGTFVAAVALRRGLEPFGLLIGEWDREDTIDERRAALEACRTLAETALADLARAATTRRTEQQAAALAEMARAGVSSANLAELLHRVARLAAQAGEARGSAVWRTMPVAEEPATSGTPDLRLEVTFGPASHRERMGRALQPLAHSVVLTRETRNVERAAEALLIAPEAAEAMRSCVIVPLVAYDRCHGALAVWERVGPHPALAAGFEPTHVDFLTALADLTALAMDQAARFQERADAERRQRDLTARVRRLERLGMLGERALRMAEEARKPVASIRGFAGRAEEGLAADDPRREYLEIIQREAERAECVLSEDLDPVLAEPPSLRLGNVNDLIQETLRAAGETLVRRRIRLLKKLSPELPALLLDGQRMRHVLGRLLQDALDAVAIGGRIRIETRRMAQHVVIELAHDGMRTAGEALDQLLGAFASGRGGGSALGLGIAERIVHEHGGEIRVRADGEWSTVIALTLPVRENQDRRHAAPDRRQGRSDRRKRFLTS